MVRIARFDFNLNFAAVFCAALALGGCKLKLANEGRLQAAQTPVHFTGISGQVDAGSESSSTEVRTSASFALSRTRIGGDISVGRKTSATFILRGGVHASQ